MDLADIPTKIDIVWAQDADPTYVRPIPDTTQQPTFPFSASWPDGFPPDTFLAPGAGGSGPDGRDMNGVLQQLSAWAQWQAAGGKIGYDSAFQATIGGYPSGAVVASAVMAGVYWRSTTDNNVTDPDTGGAGWVDFFLAAFDGVAGRIRLQANTTFFVNASTGSDANSGLDVSHPWATLQHAWNTLEMAYDLNGFTATITSAASQSYAAGISTNGSLVGATGFPSIVFNGNGSTIIAGGDAVVASGGAEFSVQGFTIRAGGNGLNSAGGGSLIEVGPNMVFGTCTADHALAQTGGQIVFGSNYSITGSAAAHISTDVNGIIQYQQALTVTLTGTPAITTFATAVNNSTIRVAPGTVFTGSATGVKYSAALNGVINTAGNTLPGSTAGSTATGGQYA